MGGTEGSSVGTSEGTTEAKGVKVRDCGAGVPLSTSSLGAAVVLGVTVGGMLGCIVGEKDGSVVGVSDGTSVGRPVGDSVGVCVGIIEGTAELTGWKVKDCGAGVPWRYWLFGAAVFDGTDSVGV